MKKILVLVGLLFGGAFAATSALYLHHERTTQAAVEADCQNREICLDRTNLAPLGRFNDGTLFHAVTQEKPNVNLSGTLGVTGATTLSNSLTLSALTASLPVFTNGTSQLTTNPMTGTGSVMMSASPTTTGTLTGAAATFSGTLGVSGVTTLTSTSTNQLLATGGTTVNTRIKLSRGTDDANQHLQIGWDRIEAVRSNVVLASPQTALSFNQVGSDGTRTPLAINSDGSITASTPVSMSSTLGVSGAVTVTGGDVRLDNAQGLYSKNASGTYRQVMAFQSGNTLDIGGTIDGGIRFLTNLGNVSGTVSTAGAWAIPGTLGVTGVATFTAAPVFSSATASTAAAFDGSKNLVSVTNTGAGNNVLATSPTISNPTVTGVLAAANGTYSGTLGVTGVSTLTGNVNINGATNTAQYGLNVQSGFIASSGAKGILSFGVGDPSSANNEYAYFVHNGTSAYLIVDKNGTGSYRPLLIQNGGATAITVATNQAITLAGSTTLAGGLTSSAGGGYEENSFTATLSGCSSGGTGVIYWTRVGKMVTLMVPAITGTASTSSGVITGVPASITPARETRLSGLYAIVNNSVNTAATSGNSAASYEAILTTSNTIQLIQAGGIVFTASGTKGFAGGYSASSYVTFTYTLQ